MGMFGWYRKRNKKWNEVFIPALIVVAWCVYVVVVGADFMEFRLIVPMMPFLFITLAYLIYHHMPWFVNRRVVAALSALVLCSASAYHGTTFKELTEDKRLDSVPILSIFYGVYPDGNWSRIGLRMKEELAGTNAKISTSAVGSREKGVGKGIGETILD